MSGQSGKLTTDFFQAADSDCDDPPNIGGTGAHTLRSPRSPRSLLLWLLLVSLAQVSVEARVLETGEALPSGQLGPAQDIYTPGKTHG